MLHSKVNKIKNMVTTPSFPLPDILQQELCNYHFYLEIFLFKNHLVEKQTNSIYLGRRIDTFFNDGCQTNI